jgi:N-acetylmuramoyl-L-alanine amidase
LRIANDKSSVAQNMQRRFIRVTTSRRFIRYGLLALNVGLLAGIMWFVMQDGGTPSGLPEPRAAVVGSDETDAPTDPLDQLSSADIAVNLARMTSTDTTVAVINQADSMQAVLSVPPSDSIVIDKPQAVNTALKSNKDIKEYVVAAGDNLAGIAAKFNVTSDSISWSNGLTGGNVTVGNMLLIPPVNGIVLTVKSGDTPDTLAQRYRANKEQIIAYNDAELSGLKVGERIIIPNGQQPAPTASRYAASSGFSFGNAAVYGFNGYIKGYCTWYVANKRIQIGRPLPANLGDAWTWDDRAGKAGLPVNNTPAYGAAVVTNSTSNPGHVAFVERVNPDGSVWISEMNSRGQVSIENSAPAGGYNRVDFKLIPAEKARSYNYIH